MPHVAGTRRMSTNVRFGLPGRNPRHPQDPAWQADLFPFTYATLSDPISGKTDGLLRRCALSVTCPNVMQTDSEHEWWASRASLLVTDLAGNHLDLPDNVRAYMIAGTPHFADPADVMRKSVAAMSLPQNPAHAGAPMRALLTDLNGWISEGVQPPSSRVPMRAHGTLVAVEGAVRPDIPGLPYKRIHTLGRFLRPERAAAQGDRPLPCVCAEGGRRWHGDIRRSPARTRGAARDLHGVESTCARFWADRAVSVAGRRGAVRADRSGAKGSARSAAVDCGALRG